MADDTLRSFLVGLSWKSDAAQERKFIAAIEGATLKAKLLGDTIEEMARKTGLAVLGVAEGFEQLYYHAERTGASAKTLNSFEYAINQVGGSATAAGASFEAMAAKLRENPGNIAYLNKMGVEIDAQTGKLQFNADLAAKYSDEMSIYTAEQYRALTGMDENTFLAIRKHSSEIKAFMAERRDAMTRSGFDPDKATADAVKFNQTWRDLFMRLGVVGDKFYSDLENDLTGPLKKLDDYVKAHQGDISEQLAKLSKAAGDAAKKFDDWVEGGGLERLTKEVGDFTGEIEEDVKELGGWKNVLEGFFFLWAGSAALGAITNVLALANAVRALTAASVAATGGGVISLLGKLGLLGASVGASAAVSMNFGEASGNAAIRDEFKKAYPNGYHPGADTDNRSWWQRHAPAWLGGRDDEHGFQPVPSTGAAGQYRPVYALGDKDLSDAVVNTIAGEAISRNQNSVDAVVNNMLNRIGTNAYGPSGNLQDVARAPGQYAGYRRAKAKEAEYIRSRIRAIASGSEPDNTNGSNEYRAGWYSGPWGRKHADSPVIGGNRFAYNPKAGVGPYAPYAKPSGGGEKSYAAKFAAYYGVGDRWGKYRDGAAAFNSTRSLFAEAPANSNVTHNNQKQDIKIHIDGSGDPNAVGAAVAAKIDRTATDLNSNFRGATQ